MSSGKCLGFGVRRGGDQPVNKLAPVFPCPGQGMSRILAAGSIFFGQ